MTEVSPDSPSPGHRPMVTTTVTAATLYGDQARVVRSGKVSLTGEEQALVIPGLPSTLDPETLRVKGAGTTPVKILGLQVDRIYNPRPVVEEVARLTQEIDALELEKQNLDAHLTVLQLQQSFVQGILEKSVDRFCRGLAEQRVGLEQTRDLLTFGSEQYRDYAGTLVQRQQERKHLEERIRALRQQLQQQVIPRQRQLYQVAIDIAPSSSGEFKLELSYTIYQASWKPLYDLRVNLKTKLVSLSYLATVQQRSGEAWQEVRLSLSTAKPGLGSLPPKLEPWYLDAAAPEPTPVARSRTQNEVAFADATLGTMAQPSMVSPIEAETVAATPTQEGGAIHFDLPHPNTVPSDGDPHKVTVFETDLNCELDYLIVPKQVTFAYLQATITNPLEGVALLPGQANIFRDEMFVGTTPIDHVAPGQTFQVALGIDEGLKVERDLIERAVDKKLIGGQRRITFSYRIRVTQLRDHVAQVRVKEQLPISRHEQIRVRLVKTEPQITPGDMGLLEWNFPLPINVKQTILYQFTVEHPPDMPVLGLTV